MVYANLGITINTIARKSEDNRFIQYRYADTNRMVMVCALSSFVILVF